MIKEIVRDKDILSKKSEKFIFGEDEEIITDMMDTAIAHKTVCAGLSAVQIGVHKRVILVQMGNRYVPIINPVIIKRSSSTYMGMERCLSLDGERIVKRHTEIKVAFTDKTGKPKCQIFKNYLAQIIQHECDHLDGVLI